VREVEEVNVAGFEQKQDFDNPYAQGVLHARVGEIGASILLIPGDGDGRNGEKSDQSGRERSGKGAAIIVGR
jgi:hypothetical protein